MLKRGNNYNMVGLYQSGKITNKLISIKEVLNYYREILYQIEILSTKLGLKDSLSIAHLYEYLLMNGYLSVEKQFAYQKKITMQPMAGMQIMSGVGNCYNQTTMLHNLLEEFNREAYMIAVRTLNSDILPNHVQILFAQKKKYCVFDPTLHLYGECDKNLNSFTSDGQAFKFGYFSTMFRISNFVNNHPSSKNYLTDSKLKLIRESNQFVNGKLVKVSENMIYDYFNLNKDLIDIFYSRVYPSICNVDSYNKMQL